MRDKIKIAIICKGIQDFDIDQNIKYNHKPKAGDVAVFEVLELGKHSSIQGLNGNNRYIFPGDIIMAAFGSRYATGQLEGLVPKKYCENYQILGKGGAIGVITSMHAKLAAKGPTQLRMIGYATKDGKVINTKYLSHKRSRFNPQKKRKSKVILSLGASMDSGKTTTAAYLCRGMSRSAKVAYFKLTGTVYAKDRSLVRDCGACFVSDFSTLGYPSTYLCSRTELLDLYESLTNLTSKYNPEYTIVEIADGLLQRETSMLLQHKPFLATVDSVVFSGGDSMSALLGYNMLTEWGVKPAAVGGLFTASPLLAREVEEVVDIPILNLDGLSDPNVIHIFDPTKNKVTVELANSYN
ncbi:hypothetical protein [Aureispira anguillae]|uniref:DUF1611 domain-containing protein n=1 Tax=Aureispira anguillae TaxID=2864201 RepID=A0A915YBH1_9BACT|nr:hypothetical protein [Aureispira anguillae]BDS10009.1 hypothetical protein AsAng_0007140 [Aureispira anguillae]